MKKNFYLDILLFISLLACIVTSVVLDFHWFSGGREVKMVLVEVHRWTGYIGTAAILLHMVWHTKWIAVAAKKCAGRGSSEVKSAASLYKLPFTPYLPI